MGNASFYIILSGAQIQAASAVRNLGVTFDTHLKFTEHIYLMVKTCTGSLIALNHARHVLPRKFYLAWYRPLPFSSYDTICRCMVRERTTTIGASLVDA